MDLNNLQSKVITTVNRHVLMICIFIFVVYIFAQFVILSSIGTKGADISATRTEQRDLRLENEVLQAQIDGARTTAILDEQVESLGLGYTPIDRIVVDYAPGTLLSSLP